MATYYVRKTGNDANAGTSAGAAWLTLGKALGAAGATSGDTVYVGAGIYRELLVVGATPASTLSIVGDVDGAQTGDPGEIRVTPSTTTDFEGASGTTLNLNGKSFLAFSNLVVENPQGTPLSSFTGHDLSFTDCALFGNSQIAVTVTVNLAANITFDRCVVYTANGNFTVTLPTSAVADYDVNVLFRNCLMLGFSNPNVQVAASGASAFKGGGVDVRSCTLLGSVGMQTNTANISTSIPCTLYDSILITSSTAIAANTTGQILEDYNRINSPTPRANAAIGVHSNSSRNVSWLMHMGQERLWGGQPRPFGTPVAGSPISAFGTNGGGPAVDMLNRPRASGAGHVIATGTATAGAATTLTDSGATWGTNAFNGAVVRITGGTGSGQSKMIKSHTGTVLTLFGNWQTNPDNTSTYVIYFGNPTDCGTATAGAATTLTQASASWTTNMWAGFTVEITAGTGAGQTNTVTSNTGTVLTVPTWGTNPDNTSKFKIYRQTSETANNTAVGALERHDTGVHENNITTDGVRLDGVADHALYIPVNTDTVTLSVRVRYDTNHGTTNKPQVILDANNGIGVSAETKTTTVGVDTYETLTFSAITPTGKGWVRLRLVSRADRPYGVAYFDQLGIA